MICLYIYLVVNMLSSWWFFTALGWKHKNPPLSNMFTALYKEPALIPMILGAGLVFYPLLFGMGLFCFIDDKITERNEKREAIIIENRRKKETEKWVAKHKAKANRKNKK